MVFEQIEKLQRDLTDKYVVVDANRPELARFKNAVGQVKTVNFSGRALVEFNEYLNIGWYDIDVDFLKVVDKPPPPVEKVEKKADKKPAAAKPAAAAATGGEKKLSPLEMARMQGAGGAAKSGDAAAKPKPSTADILAAARAKKGESPAAPVATAAASPKPAAPAAPAAGKIDRSKMSVADMIAMAKGQKPASAAAAPVEAPAAEPAEEAPAEEEAAVAKAPAAPVVAAKPAVKPAAGGDRPKAGELNTEQILAWCRAHDGK